MGKRLRSWWHKIKQQQVWWQQMGARFRLLGEQIKHHWQAILVVASILVVVIILIIVGYRFDWTGFNGNSKSGKTLWDWLDLLVIPVALAIGAFLLTKAQSKAEKDKEKRDELHDLHRRFYASVFQAFHDAKSVRRLLRATAQYLPPDRTEIMIMLEPYDKQMQTLVDIQLQFETFEDDIEQNSTLFPDDQMRNVLKIYFDIIEKYLHDIVEEYEEHYQKPTLSYIDKTLPLYKLPKLKNFIDDDSKDNKYFKLARRARKVLRKQLNWEISSLKGATKPDYKYDCDLSEVDLSGDKLKNADLSGADLRKAKVTEEQLANAKSLKGAIMPDGKMYRNSSGADLSEADLSEVDLTLQLHLFPQH